MLVMLLLILASISKLGLKWIVILVFEYSFGFQTNIPNILFTRRSGKMTILSDKITMNLVEFIMSTATVIMIMNCLKISKNGNLYQIISYNFV